MNQEYIEIELEEEPIELCNLLKVLDFAETGGQAKQLITLGYVAVNDELCTQKRKKIYSGDTLQFDGEVFKLTLSEDAQPNPRPAPEAPRPPAPKTSASKPTKNKTSNKKRKKQPSVDSKTGRRPISFG
ncbi:MULTISPECIES: RNA-binding S4 domain-containing protein [Pseudoalteromonas]|uniref:RNA-binding S4 domain-containing protein n=1 Tax=Pseudoalteromonas obscura TaxID=3048491 RepID=A0ABT7ESP7_9GAMM|nr:MULTISPECIES: RNA-binding S4 domain-containing protein [Pseudoalteromonas]MBQ4839248.1 RNA-binding S4 domain-containing protein [Pseudoalteromonas luteoviolacea]MDK2598089.1 RNA-binding S4 domain-containing protein [Pseudoalteromonas sp. P94(2023)]